MKQDEARSSVYGQSSHHSQEISLVRSIVLLLTYSMLCVELWNSRYIQRFSVASWSFTDIYIFPLERHNNASFRVTRNFAIQSLYIAHMYPTSNLQDPLILPFSSLK